MKSTLSRRDFFLSGRVVLILITVTAATGGFVLGYFVGKNPPVSGSSASKPLIVGSAPSIPPPKTDPSEGAPDQGQDPLQEKTKPGSESGQPSVAATPGASLSGGVVQVPLQSKAAKEGGEESRPPLADKSESAVSSKKTAYTVQAGAFKSKKDASALKHKLEAAGYKASIKKESNSKGKTLFKVRAGEFEDKKEAAAFALKLKNGDGLKAFAVEVK